MATMPKPPSLHRRPKPRLQAAIDKPVEKVLRDWDKNPWDDPFGLFVVRDDQTERDA